MKMLNMIIENLQCFYSLQEKSHDREATATCCTRKHHQKWSRYLWLLSLTSTKDITFVKIPNSRTYKFSTLENSWNLLSVCEHHKECLKMSWITQKSFNSENLLVVAALIWGKHVVKVFFPGSHPGTKVQLLHLNKMPSSWPLGQ